MKPEREKIVEEICQKFSCFKRDFIGAPIRRAFIAMKSGNVSDKDSC